GILRGRQPDGALARALPDGRPVGDSVGWTDLRAARNRADAPLRRTIPPHLRLVRAKLSDDVTPPGRDHAAARAGASRSGGLRPRGYRSGFCARERSGAAARG